RSWWKPAPPPNSSNTAWCHAVGTPDRITEQPPLEAVFFRRFVGAPGLLECRRNRARAALHRPPQGFCGWSTNLC
ncbi:MAG: hypothetical protein ACK4F8_15850, partial [Aquabacterium sp.]